MYVVYERNEWRPHAARGVTCTLCEKRVRLRVRAYCAHQNVGLVSVEKNELIKKHNEMAVARARKQKSEKQNKMRIVNGNGFRCLNHDTNAKRREEIER